MRTLAVLTAIPITEADLRATVIELGGKWREDHGIHQGIIVREGVEVLLTLENETVDGCSADEEPLWSRTEMGFDLKSQIVIGVIRPHCSNLDRASRVLARDVANHIAKKWAGHVDWDEVSPP